MTNTATASIASSVELHTGVIVGGASSFTRPPPTTIASNPRTALEQVVLHHLAAGPCAIQFSGGRDSSLVLAVAAHVARHEGLPLPTAVTVRYDDEPAADESDWQVLVADHVGVDLRVCTVGTGQDELTSPFARNQLERHGAGLPVTSPVLYGRLAPEVMGMTVLTGEGGDEVLGPSRVTPFVAHWRRRRRPSRAMLSYAGLQILPEPLRRSLARKDLDRSELVPWVREAPRRQVNAALAAESVRQPWRWDESRWESLDSRMWEVGEARMAEVARREGFTLAHPLLDPQFVAAVARAGGPTGLTSRTEAMRRIAGDLLPDAVLARSSKAVFNNVYAGAGVRAFASTWDGSGVDGDLVDIDVLRHAWQQEHPTAPSLVPLQLAVLADQAAAQRN